jgi:RND superfamily putative drug exporter
MAERFAAAVVRWRFAVAVGWVVLVAAALAWLPSVEEAQSGSLGDLVPLGAAAITAEERSAELFAFPLSSRTVVVERDPSGLSVARLANAARRAAEVNTDRLEIRDAEAAYGITNAVPGLPFARERNTTALTALLFSLDVGPRGRTTRAENYMEALGEPPSGTLGVTGVIPARAAQSDAMREGLPLIEVVTVAMIALAVGIYLRSLVAPVVTLITVAVSYLLAVRVIATAGSAVGVSVPTEIEPVLVALLFGVVTDYALFFMSRFRALVAGGAGAKEATRRTAAELSPIVLTCGLAVSAGTGALAVAELGFLRAFGPGMALGILVAVAVVLTLIPAVLAILGPHVFWPSHPGPHLRGVRRRRASSVQRCTGRGPRSRRDSRSSQRSAHRWHGSSSATRSSAAWRPTPSRGSPTSS